MKYIGALLILLSTTAAGITAAGNQREKAAICRELRTVFERLKTEMKYRNVSVISFFEALDSSRCRFLNSRFIKEKTAMCSPLSKEENEALSAFLFSLGKSDTASQIKCIDLFCDYIKEQEEKYRNSYRKNAKIYITFGVFSGATAALVML